MIIIFLFQCITVSLMNYYNTNILIQKKNNFLVNLTSNFGVLLFLAELNQDVYDKILYIILMPKILIFSDISTRLSQC